MSELINNREFRQNTIKNILAQLHAGKTVDEVKEQFSKAFDGVSAEEISQAEQALIREGIPVQEIQRLCDVHAEVFKGSIEEIHRIDDPALIPGHPVNTLKRENHAIQKLIKELRRIIFDSGDEIVPVRDSIKEELNRLYSGIDIHYKKKENLLFPYMEQYGITAPPKVMWGVDDEIREMLKVLSIGLETTALETLRQFSDAAFTKVTDMIFKEENILLPILLENLTQEEWKEAADGSEEFGYCLIKSVRKWEPEENGTDRTTQNSAPASEVKHSDGQIQLPTGTLTVEELTNVLNALPMDITFVGKDDTVRYFSQGKERIFPRTPSVLGRNVSNCHPPASVHIVEKLVEDFKNGVKDSEDFWIRMKDMYVLIRYYAVRNPGGEYLGVLEVTQNIGPIQAITGEKRLVNQ